MTINALTFNVHKLYNFSNTKYVLHELRSQLESLPLDIVFLQEIRGIHPKNKASNFENDPLEHLADQLWDYAAYGKNAIYPQGHHGNAILSKYPFVEWQNFDISNHKLEKRGILIGKCELPGNKELFLANTHIDLTQWGRNKQIDKIIEILESHIPQGAPLLVCGDFNDWNSKVKGIMQDNGFQSLADLRTFPAFAPIFCLDRGFYRNLKINFHETLDHPDWASLSDHLPIHMEFEL